MADFATSTEPALKDRFAKLMTMTPGVDQLGLERVTALLDRLGNPQERLPPVLHVAGTNGKGSTCAFLRAAIEAAGLICHVYTSPHLVRFNERIRLSGRLIDDDLLASLLDEAMTAAHGLDASFFEITTAAAFLAFSRMPADACIVEVGLGGRLDATNVLVHPLVTGIAQLGIDHQAFLGDTVEDIAGEKAGIAKPGVPLVTMHYPPNVAARVEAVARTAGASLSSAGATWSFAIEGEGLIYRDDAGVVETPLPALAGSHQPENLALAIAMLRHQSRLLIPAAAFAEAARSATWPARMQHLKPGPLTALLPRGSDVWLDGGHNPAAGTAVASLLAAKGGNAHLVVGMLANKDAKGLLEPIVPYAASVTGVPVPDHDHHAPADLAEAARALGVPSVATAAGITDALHMIADRSPEPPLILIVGTLYLAGVVLQTNEELPD